MKEIERKFLVNKEQLPLLNKKKAITILQGYILNTKELTVRIRIADKKGFLTIKGKTERISREEYEYEIPYQEAFTLMKNHIKEKIEKKRNVVFFKNKKWEIDIFSGNLEGLIIAEIELKSENEKIAIPVWCKKEVSKNSNYYNSELVKLSSVENLF